MLLADACGTYRENVIGSNKRKQFVVHPALLKANLNMDLSTNVIGGEEGVTTSIVTLAQPESSVMKSKVAGRWGKDDKFKRVGRNGRKKL